MTQAAVEAAEVATREILRHRDRARELLDPNPLTDGFRLFDPSAVLLELSRAQAAIADAIRCVRATDWSTPAPPSRSKEGA